MQNYHYNVVKWNLEKYNSSPKFYQQFQILLLMENANTHLVSIFKDFLLLDDMTEFFKEYYVLGDIYPRLKKIYEYYEYSSYLFPNYTALKEGKYIYRNIIKKQRLIDYLEDMEEIKREKENKAINKKEKDSKENEQKSSYVEVFDSKVYDSIRKETNNDSNLDELFCIGNKNENSRESDSMLSILKLTEEIKNKDKSKIQNNLNNNNLEKIKNKASIINSPIHSLDNKTINSTKDNSENTNHTKKEETFYKNRNLLLNNKNKIYVSRRIKINQNINNKIISKHLEQNNNSISYQKENLINKKLYNNFINKNKILVSEPNKRNEFFKKYKTNQRQKNENNNYLKKNNNIIINIINNNKNNNFQNNSNYFPNFTNNSINNISKINIMHSNSKNYSSNYTFAGGINNDNVFINNINKNIILYNTNNNSNRKIDNKSNLNDEKLIKYPLSYRETTIKSMNSIENNKKILNSINREIKPKILSMRLNSFDTNLINNLKERIKNPSQSNSIKKVKNKKKDSVGRIGKNEWYFYVWEKK